MGLDYVWLTHVRSALEAANREYRMLTTQVAFFEQHLREGDWSAELDGTDEEVAFHIAGFATIVVRRIQDDGMEASGTKSVVSASHDKLANDLSDKLRPVGINHTRRVKSLGVGLAAGTRRIIQVMKARLNKFSPGFPRFGILP